MPPTLNHWTPTIIEAFRVAHAQGKTIPDIRDRFNTATGWKISKATVKCARQRYGLAKFVRNNWTPEAIDLVREHYGNALQDTVARRINKILGTQFTGRAIQAQASRLGINMASNQGQWTIAAAAVELNVSQSALREFLHRARLPLTRHGRHVFLSEKAWSTAEKRYARPTVSTVGTDKAAQRLAYTVDSVYRFIKEKKLEAIKVAGRVLVTVASIERFEQAQLQGRAVTKIKPIDQRDHRDPCVDCGGRRSIKSKGRCRDCGNAYRSEQMNDPVYRNRLRDANRLRGERDRKPEPTPAVAAKVVKLRDAGWTYRAIAKEIGVSKAKALKIAKEAR